MPGDTNANSDAVSAVTVKLPAFLPTNPRWYFMFAESQFRLKNVTADKTRFNYMACSLPAEVASRVMSVLDSPPDTGKYDALKQRLLKEYTLTDTK